MRTITLYTFSELGYAEQKYALETYKSYRVRIKRECTAEDAQIIGMFNAFPTDYEFRTNG